MKFIHNRYLYQTRCLLIQIDSGGHLIQGHLHPRGCASQPHRRYFGDPPSLELTPDYQAQQTGPALKVHILCIWINS